jgi:hypothetical protein
MPLVANLVGHMLESSVLVESVVLVEIVHSLMAPLGQPTLALVVAGRLDVALNIMVLLVVAELLSFLIQLSSIMPQAILGQWYTV